MSAAVLPFPVHRAGSIGALARAVGDRWADSLPVVRIAVEFLGQDDAGFRAKVRGIVDQGAVGLMYETDRALAETVADLAILTAALDQARARLRAALAACPEPPAA